MTKKIAILQSNYLPWKGYFELINNVDEFYFLDDVQYTKNDWRNRNQIYVNFKKIWLTIPTGISKKRLISEVTLSDKKWKLKHFDTMVQGYKKSKYFDNYINFFKDFYFEKNFNNLSLINKYLIKYISKEILKIKTSFHDVESLKIKSTKEKKLLEICEKVNAKIYLSGPNGKNYLNKDNFNKKGIKLEYYNYGPYKEYKQFSNKFDNQISIMDLIFNCGPEASTYFLSIR